MITPPDSRPVAGILWMFVSGLTFVAVTGIVRYLGTDLPAAENAFIRYAIGVVLLSPAIVCSLRGGFVPGAFKLFAARGLVHSLAVILWFFAMARIPVSEVTAIGYLNPIGVTIGAAIIFGEKLALRRILAVLVALLGALIILRPGLREVGEGHLAQLAAAMLFASSYLFAKRLSELAQPGAIVAMMSLSVTIFLAPMALPVWVTPTLTQVAWLGLVAVFATAGHYFMTRAFQCAPLTVTQPVTFLQLVWATLLGSLAFGETVDPFVLLGGGLIIGAISYITWREAQVRRATITPPPQAAKL
jgi:drug/metabolite transporter (DMT)-like permease